MMRRTTGLLITLALGLLMAPLAAEAQPPTKVHRIGVLASSPSPGPGRSPFTEAFLEEMRALGYVEGQHLVLESRLAAGQYERFPALAAELVRLPVDVLVVPNTPAALAAKQATTTSRSSWWASAIRWGVASSPASPGPGAISPDWPPCNTNS